jgi:predicted SnoaL-like aldol condensation-catalyzing enzyme
MTKDEMKALVHRMYHAANTGDVAAVDDIFAPDFYSHPLQKSGREPIREGWIAIRAKFPDLHVEADDLLVEGDRIAVRATVRNVSAVDGSGSATLMEMIRVADGRIAELWGVTTVQLR